MLGAASYSFPALCPTVIGIITWTSIISLLLIQLFELGLKKALSSSCPNVLINTIHHRKGKVGHTIRMGPVFNTLCSSYLKFEWQYLNGRDQEGLSLGITQQQVHMPFHPLGEDWAELAS